jgi:secreted trypsin-like serine protease
LNGYATGFGAISKTNIKANSLMKQVKLPILNDKYCEKYFKINTTTQFCAGNKLNNSNTCKGDSGGPLVTWFNKRWYLIGITSWGFECGGVYTRIEPYLNWIQNKIIN